MSESAQAAVDMHLAGLCISDHYDLECPGGTTAFSFDIDEHQAEIDRLQKVHGDRIKLLKGIEVGVQVHCIDKVRKLVDDHSFDLVIASIHFIEGMDPYYGEYYKGYDRATAYRKYFEHMYECITGLENFDVLGHFDYIARYAPYPDYSIKYRDFPDHFDEIFKYLIYNGKVLEVNTNTYRERDGKSPELDLNILKRYRELGGELISLGSDAHDTFRVGENLEEYARKAYSAGIRYTCHFEERKLVGSRIDL